MEHISDFLGAVDPAHKAFVEELHGILSGAGRKVKFEDKAAGPFVSYSDPKTRRSVLNFYFRKNGLHVRLYPETDTGNAALTDSMVSDIAKAPDCKRLKQTAECNPKCVMGYDFELRGTHYQKCRYTAFQFLVTEENKPVITKWVAEELVKSL